MLRRILRYDRAWKKQAPTEDIVFLGHGRWRIENQGFNERNYSGVVRPGVHWGIL